MPYYKLLQKIIADTNYTQKEIAEKCTELGTPISRSYINKLECNKSPAPTEEISRAISKVCNVDERLLVIEGYLDKAPKEIQEALNNIKLFITMCTLNTYKNKIDNNIFKELQNNFDKEPLSNFVIALTEIINNMLNINDNKMELISKTDEDKIILSLTKPIFLKSADNGMFPLIKENDEIMLDIKKQYANGDIVMVNLKKENKAIIRQIIFLGSDIQLIPLNKKYTKKIYKKDDISIIGKVEKIIQEI